MYCCRLFFKQKTAYDMRISDWSSDVCSSDLICVFAAKASVVERGLMVVVLGVHSLCCQETTKAFLLLVVLLHRRCGSEDAPSQGPQKDQTMRRSEARRVGKECVSKCRYRWSTSN